MRYILYFVIAIFATTLGSTTGIGGGVIMKPVLDMLGHYDVGSIAMLSSITVFTMAAVSLFTCRKSPEKPKMNIALPLAIGAVAGGNLGSVLLNRFIAQSSGEKVVLTQNVLLAALVVLVFIYMLKKEKLPSYALKGILSSALTGIFLGVTASFLGIGGGPINVAIIIFLFSFPTKTATICSLITILFSQASKLLVTAITVGFTGYNLSMLPVMVVGGVAGGLIGGAIHKQVDNKATDKLFNSAQILVFAMCVINIIRNI